MYLKLLTNYSTPDNILFQSPYT